MTNSNSPIAHNTLQATMRLLGRFAKPHSKWVVGAIGCFIAAMGCELVRPYFFKQAIDVGVVGGQYMSLLLYACLVFAVTFLGHVVAYFESLFLSISGCRTTKDARNAVHEHMLSLPCQYFSGSSPGKIMTHLIGDVGLAFSGFTSNTQVLITNSVMLIGIVGTMFLLSPRLALVSLALMPMLFVITGIFRKFIRRQTQITQKCFEDYLSFSHEAVEGVSLVQIFNRTSSIQDRHQDLSQRLTNAMNRAQVVSILNDVSTVAAVRVTTVILLYFIARWLSEPQITIGLAIAFLQYLEKANQCSGALIGVLGSIQPSIAAADRLQSFLNEPIESDTVRKTSLSSHTETTFLQFENVSFGYNSATTVINKLSVDIGKRERIAIVGPSGAGKTSIANLLVRFYEPQVGSIRLAGVDIRDIPLLQLRTRIAVLGQESLLFSGTVAENILLGSGDGDQGVLQSTADKMGLSRLLSFDHRVVSHGANLSAGEKQLIAICRILIRKPEILILDEATAKVDSVTEEIIGNAVASLMAECTSITIAHRLKTVENADRILVFESGNLVEQGKHAHLLSLGGTYSRLVAAQHDFHP